MATTTTYSPAYGSRSAAAPKRKGLLQRFVDRMVEARMRRLKRSSSSTAT